MMFSSTHARLGALAVATAALVLFPTLADARGGRGGGGGGGFRASGASSVSRGGGGMSARGGGGGRSMASSRPAGGGNRAAQRPAGGDRSRYSGGDRANISGGNRANIGGGDRTNIGGGDRTDIRGGGNRINTGDVNIDRNVNVNGGDWDHGGGWYDNDYHPIAAGVAFGAAAAVTSAAIGSMYYSLPPSCSPYPYSGYTYYSCGGVYYQPQYQGSTVTYVVVDEPH